MSQIFLLGQAYEDQPKPSLKDPVKEPIPVLLTDSQSYLEEVSRDSPHQTKGLLYKTSEADLSCDMFNGETASSIAERGIKIGLHQMRQKVSGV